MSNSYILPVRNHSNDLPKDSELLLLGTWALGEEDLRNKNKLLILDYCYDNQIELYDDYLYVRKLYSEILPIIGKLMNEYHSLQWGSRSFKIFYGMWLHDYLPVIRERYQTIQLAIETHPSTKFILTDEDINILTSSDFKQKISQDAYNHYLYSRIVKFIDKKTYEDSYFLPKGTKEKSTTNLLTHSFKRKIVNFLLRAFQNLFSALTRKSKGAIDWSYFPKMKFLELCVKAFPKITPIIYLPQLRYANTRENSAHRAELKYKFKNEFTAQNIFEEFLVDNLIYDMPLAFIENFQKVLKASHYINIKNKNYLSSNAILSNQVLQCATADQLSYSNNLIIAQHGGSYGIAKWSMQEFYELDVADRFITFGWSKGEFPKIAKISHPKLILPITKKNVVKDKILYLTVGQSRYFNRNWSNPTAGKSIINYYENILSFLKNMDPVVMTKVHVRLSASNDEYRIGMKQYLNDMVPLSHGDYYKELQSAAIVVCDNNQTTFLESLTSNKPTIIVWNNKYTEINYEASFYFKELAKVGIFHTCHEEASSYLSNIVMSDSIEEWWTERSRQNAVNSFVNEYAKRNLDWVSDYKTIACQ